MEDTSILDKVLSSKQVADIENFHPSDLLGSLLKHLSSKEEEILRRRFGLQNEPKETLEEIGKRYNVTRERVRQIENASIKKLHSLKEFRPLTESTEELIRQILETHGGAMTDDDLFRELFRSLSPSENEIRSVQFLLHELFYDKFDRVGKTQSLENGWKVKTASLTVLHDTIHEIDRAIAEHSSAVTLHDLLELLRGKEFFQTHPDRLTEEIITSSMELAPNLGHNPYQEYGLASWGTVLPRRMNDKIYLVLKKHGKPMHFTEITNQINATGFDKRKAYPPTVHNELILNKQYVLVGRGIYALKEWGYQPGVVADVLQEILHRASAPMTRDELVAKVLEQRIVKKNTIHLALADKSRFQKLTDGRYQLAQQQNT